jgi:hypothetical protein
MKLDAYLSVIGLNVRSSFLGGHMLLVKIYFTRDKASSSARRV